jgi:host factor-I protein
VQPRLTSSRVPDPDGTPVGSAQAKFNINICSHQKPELEVLKRMSKQQVNLQDFFLNQVRKDGTSVTIYLVNGFQSKGIVRGFDNFTVILEVEGKQQMVYKHAISTIMPQRPINLLPEINRAQEENKI